MRFRSPILWWPILVVALVAGCDDDKTPSGTGGSGGSGGTAGTGGSGGGSSGSGGTAGTGASGGAPDGGTPPSDGGLVPCPLGQPTDLDRPPSGRLPCELLPPGFVAP